MAAPVYSDSVALTDSEQLLFQSIKAKLFRELHALPSDEINIARVMVQLRSFIDQEILAGICSDVRESTPVSSPACTVPSAQQILDDQQQQLLFSNALLPQWFTDLLALPQCHPLLLPEWSDSSYRRFNGWAGDDYVHSITSPARVVAYALLPASSSTYPSLIGVAHFKAACESHKRFCHGPPLQPQPVHMIAFLTPQPSGGSACALFDDAVGWMGFCHTGTVVPWSGFTAQVNTSLKRPIPVGSVLMLRATVDRVEGRKVTAAQRTQFSDSFLVVGL
jgi:hypothetical protein